MGQLNTELSCVIYFICHIPITRPYAFSILTDTHRVSTGMSNKCWRVRESDWQSEEGRKADRYSHGGCSRGHEGGQTGEDDANHASNHWPSTARAQRIAHGKKRKNHALTNVLTAYGAYGKDIERLFLLQFSLIYSLKSWVHNQFMMTAERRGCVFPASDRLNQILTIPPFPAELLNWFSCFEIMYFVSKLMSHHMYLQLQRHDDAR